MLIKGCLLTGKKVYCVVNNEINRPHKINIFSHYTRFVFNNILDLMERPRWNNLLVPSGRALQRVACRIGSDICLGFRWS